jgi:uncharacterized protein
LTAFHDEIELRVAHNFFQRLRGLAGRKHLDACEALWLKPCSAIHTFHMKMPIAVFLLDTQDRVFGVRPCVPPGRLVWVRGTYSVIEMAALEKPTVQSAVRALQAAISVWQARARGDSEDARISRVKTGIKYAANDNVHGYLESSRDIKRDTDADKNTDNQIYSEKNTCPSHAVDDKRPFVSPACNGAKKEGLRDAGAVPADQNW